eukprot:6325620-Prymnesium_polylepis.2
MKAALGVDIVLRNTVHTKERDVCVPTLSKAFCSCTHLTDVNWLILANASASLTIACEIRLLFAKLSNTC